MYKKPKNTHTNLGGNTTMGENMTLVIVLVLLLIMSAYFSATETAFSSLNKVRLKHMASDGKKGAKLAYKMSEDFDKVLSTILIGNNIVNIMSASLATLLFIDLMGENIGITVSTIVMTILVLIFGEISPKSLAKEAPERFAIFSAPILRFFTVVLFPINLIFVVWKKLLSKVFKISEARGMTEEELITMVEEATQDGGIDKEDSDLIRSAIEFNDIDVRDILTPRIDIIGVEESLTSKEVSEIFIESGYSRLPVYRETIDNIVGVIHLKDFYSKENDISEILKNVIYTVHTTKISDLLKTFQSTKSHIAVVSDEYGGTLGIVTLEDIIEELIGEVWDESDEVINEFEQIGEMKYRISCSANPEKMFKLFGKDIELESSTVSGWVIEELGKIPNEGDVFTFQNYHVEVTKTLCRRVLEIVIKQKYPENDED